MKHFIAAGATLLLLSWSALAQAPAASGSDIPRMPDGKPDFSGLYNIPYTPNMALGKEQDVPYTDRGRQAYLNHDSKDDPTANCWFPGVPRIMQSPYPARIVQTHDYLVILFEYMTMHRIIPLDGRPHPVNMEPTFMGDSVGHWDGDTLIVDTTNLKDAPWTWLDTAGHQHSDQLHLVERFQKMDNDNIKWTVTFEDPKFYTEPWSITLPIKRQNTEIMSYSCEENEKDRVHLKRTNTKK